MSDQSGAPPPTLRAPASDYITPYERGLLHAISTSTGTITKGMGELQKGVLGSAVSAFRVPSQEEGGYCASSQQAVKDCLAMVYQRGEQLAKKEDNIGRGGDDVSYNGAAPPPITPSHVLFRTSFHTCDEPLRAFVQCSEASTAEYVRELGKREEKE